MLVCRHEEPHVQALLGRLVDLERTYPEFGQGTVESGAAIGFTDLSLGHASPVHMPVVEGDPGRWSRLVEGG